MGTIKQGVLGGFSGKVGTVIGSSWKGISYMRGQAQHINNPKTPGQLDQRSKFAITIAFLKPITNYVRTGYKTYAHRQTEFNAAMSYIIKNAIRALIPIMRLIFRLRSYRAEISHLPQVLPLLPQAAKLLSHGRTTAATVMLLQPTSQCR